MLKTINMYLHSCKESNSDLGEEIGLSGEALSNFRHALSEVEFEVEVDTETGYADIIRVDGKYLQQEGRD